MNNLSQFRSTSLNLWNVEDKTSKFDIDVSSASVSMMCTGAQNIVMHPIFHLKHSSGDINDVGQKINDLDLSIVNAIANFSSTDTNMQALIDSNYGEYNAFKTTSNTTLAQLRSDLDAETANRTVSQAADATARAELFSTVNASLASESASRVAGDNALQVALDQEILDRTAGDNALQASVAQEASNRSAGDDALQTALDNEISSRESEDALVRGDLTNEIVARQNADTALQASINVEKVRIDNILAGASVDLDSFTEIIDKYNAVDNDVLNTISNLTNQINDLKSRLDSLTDNEPTA